MTQKQQDRRNKKAWNTMLKEEERENKRHSKVCERIIAKYCRNK